MGNGVNLVLAYVGPPATDNHHEHAHQTTISYNSSHHVVSVEPFSSHSNRLHPSIIHHHISKPGTNTSSRRKRFAIQFRQYLIQINAVMMMQLMGMATADDSDGIAREAMMVANSMVMVMMMANPMVMVMMMANSMVMVVMVANLMVMVMMTLAYGGMAYQNNTFVNQPFKRRYSL